jgi:adenosylcobinamide-phosphate synthase
LFLSAVIIALVLDFTLGDPAWRQHPVRVLGYLISYLEPRCREIPAHPRVQGCLFLALNMAVFIVPICFILLVASNLGALGHAIFGTTLYFALGGTCLARDVYGVADSLGREGLASGREKLRMLVSRDVDGMDETAVSSSAIETLSENFSDSAVATLIYAALGGPVLAWIHRISNTLDAMVGYKTDEYIEFGWASARLDDILNYIPSRVSVVIVALASGDAIITLECARSHGRALSSPNSGYPIAAFAGALGLRLCGPASYFGVLHDKPFIGDGNRPLSHDISRALMLYWNSYAIAAATSVLAALLIWR